MVEDQNILLILSSKLKIKRNMPYLILLLEVDLSPSRACLRLGT